MKIKTAKIFIWLTGLALFTFLGLMPFLGYATASLVMFWWHEF